MQHSHIVYMIEFVSRKENNQEPYYYIGSKSNCFFDGTNILTKKGVPYYGSSRAAGYKEALQSGEIKIHILGSYDNYEDCIKSENRHHVDNDVVADTRFWNLSNAAENNYANPDYTTVRNTRTRKTVRLPKNHPLIESGDYVGTTAGMHWFTDGKEDMVCSDENVPAGWVRGRSRTEQCARGDEHYMRKTPLSEEEVARRIAVRKQNMEEMPEKYEPGKRRQQEASSRTHKGIPKSTESNAKRSASSKGYITLKNLNSGECVRIKREEAVKLDPAVWQNPYKLAEKRLGAKWYNNGTTSKKLFPEDTVPENFVIGRIKWKSKQ